MDIVMRWIHILSMAVLVGGFIFARFVLAPAARAMGGGIDRERLSGAVTAVFKPFLIAAMAGSLGTGVYNFMTKTGFPPGYHAFFGIKMLLALHIFGVGFLLATRRMDAAKRDRLSLGVAISGVAVLLISAYLRHLSLAAR